jgi:uncharacterized protein YcbK (DUF882 family)
MEKLNSRRKFLVSMGLLISSSSLYSDEYKYSKQFLNLFGDFLKKRSNNSNNKMIYKINDNITITRDDELPTTNSGDIIKKTVSSPKSYVASENSRVLKFFLPRYSKNAEVTYKDDSGYINSSEVSEIFKDHYNGQITSIDNELLDLLYDIQQKNGGKRIELLSGYRSRKTNNMLRRKNRGVAKNSYHIKGQAADIRIRMVSPNRLAKMAKKLKVGGVGKYNRSRFVHVDTGPIRSWNG